MCAGVSGVVDQHRAVAQTCVDVVTVVQTPAAAPHRFTCVIGLNYCVGQQTATHTHILSNHFMPPSAQNEKTRSPCSPGQFYGVVQRSRQQQTVILPVEGQTSDLFAVDGDILTGFHVDHAHLLHPAAWNQRWDTESESLSVPSFKVSTANLRSRKEHPASEAQSQTVPTIHSKL